ncbi:hypothetical protein F7734_04090 [Scytonema sp. UIC 10036]|uniref:hypothetical protein n=1 Tax=Scytonema sp. UIC 10036 TaxID=2304196 RepID=UPI0012DA6263|nr:hypothetical protein [Scytonema sp. UIC 10036]MUG91705.1 hypothetical protein [Scytonema sp. UIC 10036]
MATDILFSIITDDVLLPDTLTGGGDSLLFILEIPSLKYFWGVGLARAMIQASKIYRIMTYLVTNID